MILTPLRNVLQMSAPYYEGMLKNKTRMVTPKIQICSFPVVVIHVDLTSSSIDKKGMKKAILFSIPVIR
jgi:hypothetical protein